MSITDCPCVSVQACHDLVPPDWLQPVMRHLCNQFVHDRARPEEITVGLKTVREICMRMPLIMSEEVLLVSSPWCMPLVMSQQVLLVGSMSMLVSSAESPLAAAQTVWQQASVWCNPWKHSALSPPLPPPHLPFVLSPAVSPPCSVRHMHPYCRKGGEIFNTLWQVCIWPCLTASSGAANATGATT